MILSTCAVLDVTVTLADEGPKRPMVFDDGNVAYNIPQTVTVDGVHFDHHMTEYLRPGYRVTYRRRGAQ